MLLLFWVNFEPAAPGAPRRRSC